MTINVSRATKLWTLIADELDIAPSLYEKAAARHASVGEWLCRPGSSLAVFDPHVSPQGSFRYGTVNKPVFADAEYDLDHVVVLRGMSVYTVTQAQLMERFGRELAGYAKAHGMLPPVPKRRCWRLRYRDEVGFHLDSLPCVPAEQTVYQALRARGIEESFVRRAIAITDETHPQYQYITDDWLTSNPRGFAKWFESRAAKGRASSDLTVRAGTVEPVPSYRWKTPLQRSVQILKRHRDVMFKEQPALAPISMIITNLAACAYNGEQDLGHALRGIIVRMNAFVQPVVPRVPNPTHPEEDYADKWREVAQLEPHFWLWLEQAKADVLRWSDAFATIDGRQIERGFDVRLDAEVLRGLQVGAPSVVIGASSGTAEAVARPTRVDSGPRPWGR